MLTQTSSPITTRRERFPGRFQRTFSGNENHVVSLDQAICLTEKYRLNGPKGIPLGAAFNSKTIITLMNQQQCAGIRIYLAAEDDKRPAFVLVGVDSNNGDMIEGVLARETLGSPKSLLSRLSYTAPSCNSRQDLEAALHEGSCAAANQLVSLAEAGCLTRNFRESTHAALGKGGFFARSIFARILNEIGCVGIQVYHGLKEDGGITLVLAGVEAAGRHYAKWPFGDDIFFCPPFCAPRNCLNS